VWNARIRVDSAHGLHQFSNRRGSVSRVYNYGNTGQPGCFPDTIRTGEDAIPQLGTLFLKTGGLCPQHKMWKINTPLVWRHIGTFGHVTQVTQVALVNHFPIVSLIYAINLQGRGLIDQVK
jgi:hypothetical protein